MYIVSPEGQQKVEVSDTSTGSFGLVERGISNGEFQELYEQRRVCYNYCGRTCVSDRGYTLVYRKFEDEFVSSGFNSFILFKGISIFEV